jgi:hypothetical protein
MRKRLLPLLVAASQLLALPIWADQAPTTDPRFQIPATDDGLPGAGPIRRYDWFKSLWNQKRSAWAGRIDKDQKAVVFLGDSITDGWKLAEYFPGKPYINRGISGQTTPQMLIRMRPDVIAHKPKAIVILAGTNDIAGNTGPMTIEMITDNYASIAELAKANGIKVIFASVLPIHDYGKTKISEKRSPNTGARSRPRSSTTG